MQKQLCVLGLKPTDRLGTAGVSLRLQILYSPCSELQRTSRNVFAIRAVNVGTRFRGGSAGEPQVCCFGFVLSLLALGTAGGRGAE